MSDSKVKRDFSLERFVDSLILSRGYFDSDGCLQAERLVGDALLIKRLIYGDGPMESGPARSDSARSRAAAITETDSSSTDHNPA